MRKAGLGRRAVHLEGHLRRRGRRHRSRAYFSAGGVTRATGLSLGRGTCASTIPIYLI
jgi:hypothetical protein